MKKSLKKQSSNTEKNVKSKNKVAHIRNAIPVSFDNETNLFVDEKGHYIKMVRVQGINLFGFKKEDQDSYINALRGIFSNTIGKAQIYSYEVPADVDGYAEDYEYAKQQLNLTNPQDSIKYEILSKNQARLVNTSITRELVDRIFLVILKDTDLQRLQQKVNEVISALGAYNKCTELSTLEIIAVIYDYYNPRSSQMGNIFDNAKLDDLNVMDYIYPDYLSFANIGVYKKVVNVNNVYCRTKYYSQALGSGEIFFAFLSYMATLIDVDFSLHWEPGETEEVKKCLNKSFKNSQKNMDNSKDATSQKTAQQEAQKTSEMLDSFISEGDTGLYFSVCIRLKSDTIESLDELTKQVDKRLSTLNIRMRDGVFQPLELFNLSAPICWNELPAYMQLCNTHTLANGYPFVFETLYDHVPVYSRNDDLITHMPPIYVGNTIDTGGVVFYDNFTKEKDRTNYNEFIVGNSGMGKTFFLMGLIRSRLALGYKQFIIDVEGKELNKLTKRYGGTNINCGNGDRGRINPLQLRFNIPDDDTGEGKIPLNQIKPLAEHLRFLRTFFDSYKGDYTNDIALLEDTTIEEALETIYERHGITFETTAQYVVDNFKSEDYPIMSELYDELQNKLNLAKNENPRIPEKISRIEKCVAFIRPLALGADSSIFNGCTNVDIDADIVNFDISSINNNMKNRVLKTQYFNVLSFIWTEIISNMDKRRIQIYADEFSVIMDPRYMDIMIYFGTIIKRARKYYGGLTTATQMIQDVLKESVKDQGQAIIEQSTYQFFFGLGAQGTEYFKNTNLIPESEIDFISRAQLGQCYAKIGSQTAMRVHVTPDDETLEEFESMKS